jgi:hypothetical protein
VRLGSTRTGNVDLSDAFPSQLGGSRAVRGRRIGPLQFVASERESTLLIHSGPFREGAAFDVNADRMVRIIDRVGPEAGDVLLQDGCFFSVGSGLVAETGTYDHD